MGKRKSDVLDDLQYSASEKEEDELEEVVMSSSAIEVDANYDPEAEFFSYGARKNDEDINDDLQVSESEEEGEIRDDFTGRAKRNQSAPRADDEDDGGLWF